MAQNIPALRIPDAPDVVGSYGRGVQVRNLMNVSDQQQAMSPGQQQLQQQQIQAGAQGLQQNKMQLQQQQQDAQDQKTIQEAAAARGGSVLDALPDLSGKISPKAYTALVDHVDKKKKETADLTKVETENQKAASDNMLGLIDEASKLPPDQYQQMLPQIMQRALEINPKLKGQIDPSKSIPQNELSHLGIGLTLESQLAAQSLAKRQENAAKLMEKRQADAADLAERTQTERGRHNKAMENRPVGGSIAPGSDLSDEAKNQAADKYWESGVMPSMGMGAAGAASKREIMNRSSERHPGGSLAANSAEYKANQASLGKLQTNFDQVTAFENTAKRNLSLLEDTAAKIPDLGSRYANIPIRMINDKMIGTENMAAFNVARTVALTEVGKLLSSANASGVLSDSARQEAESLVGKDATFGSIKKAIGVIRKDMQNRHESYQEQIADIKGRLKGGAQGNGQSQQGASGKEVHYKVVGGKLVAQ